MASARSAPPLEAGCTFRQRTRKTPTAPTAGARSPSWRRAFGPLAQGVRSQHWARDFFHWFQRWFAVDLKGNSAAPPYEQAGALGEGFASMMPSVLVESRHIQLTPTYNCKVKDGHGWSEVEHLDFQGNHIRNDSTQPYWPGLPSNLFVDVIGMADGGWPHRILWDIYDSSPQEIAQFFFRMECANGSCSVPASPVFDGYGQFDQVGSPAIFRDILQNYISGNVMKSNPVVTDPQSEWYYEDRGFPGIDTTEFIDGLVCRSGTNHQDIERLVNDVMDFQLYNTEHAPTLCP